MIDKSEIIAQLPYEKPFLFVDEIISVSNEGIVGTSTFLEDLDFYKFSSRESLPKTHPLHHP